MPYIYEFNSIKKSASLVEYPDRDAMMKNFGLTRSIIGNGNIAKIFSAEGIEAYADAGKSRLYILADAEIALFRPLRDNNARTVSISATYEPEADPIRNQEYVRPHVIPLDRRF